MNIGTTRNRKTKNVYDIAYSDEYLKQNGFILWGYKEGQSTDDEDNNLLAFLSNRTANRLICTGPLIDPVPLELGVSWGPFGWHRTSMLDSIGNYIPGGEHTKDFFNAVTGRSEANFASTIQIVDGYSFPEITLNTVLCYHTQKKDYMNFINGLISVAAPSPEYATLGNFGSPGGYIPPFFVNKYTSDNKAFVNTAPLHKACAIQLGSYRVVRGLLINGISFVPSTTYTFTDDGYTVPTFMKVSIRAMGARVLFEHEYAEQFFANGNINFNKGVKSINKIKPNNNSNRKNNFNMNNIQQNQYNKYKNNIISGGND